MACLFLFYMLMSQESNYVEINKQLWNEKTPHHVESAFYDMPAFMAGANSLKSPELHLLGDVKGKSVLHLQCHFGQDTLSLARMGASVTGVDLSDKAIAKANDLAAQLQLEATFICCSIYDLPRHLDRQFDVVFTSYGTIGWLPDVAMWADVVARFMKPGGAFVFVEFHPALWMFDNDFTHVQYSYFNKAAIVEQEQGTYANRNAEINLRSVSWNHSLADVIQGLIRSGLEVIDFAEYDYSPYNCFANTIEVSPGVFRIRGMEEKLPMMYSLKCRK